MSRKGSIRSILTACVMAGCLSLAGGARAEGLGGDLVDALVQSAASYLAEAIAISRDEALSAGVRSVPPAIRRELAGFVDREILDSARYRVGGGGALSLQANALRYGGAAAITLDHVIVFASESDARTNTVRWVHELVHVRQYRDWGVDGFARRYVSDHDAVEQEARDEEQRYLAWAGRE